MSMEIYEQQLAESARQERRLYELADQMARECPWMWGRGNDLSNLQTLCRPCNSKKGAKING